MRFAVLGALVLAVVMVSCGGGATQYEVVVQFNTSVTQADIEEVEALLRSYDDDLEFFVQESFPPTGQASLETEAADFCPTVEAELEVKTYVEDVTCKKE